MHGFPRMKVQGTQLLIYKIYLAVRDEVKSQEVHKFNEYDVSRKVDLKSL